MQDTCTYTSEIHNAFYYAHAYLQLHFCHSDIHVHVHVHVHIEEEVGATSAIVGELKSVLLLPTWELAVFLPT